MGALRRRLADSLSLHSAQTTAIADHIAMRMDSRFGNVALVLSTVRSW